MHKKTRLTGYLAITGASIFWGTTFPVIKFGLSELELSPITFLFTRFLLTVVILSPLLLRRDARRAVAQFIQNPDIMILGILNGAAYTFQFIGQARVSSILASLMLNTYVLFTPIFARALLGTRITRRQKLATLIGFLGTAVITFGNIKGTDDILGSIVGLPMVLAAGVLYGLYIAFAEKTLDSMRRPMAVFYASTVYSLLVILIAGLVLWDLPGIRPVPPRAFLPIGYLSLFCTALAFTLYLYAIHRIGSVDSAVYLLLNIVVGIILSYVMLREVPDLFIYTGASLIFLSIYLVKNSKNP